MPNGEFEKQLEDWEKKAKEHQTQAQAAQQQLVDYSKLLEVPQREPTFFERLYRIAKPFILEWGPLFPSDLKERQARETARVNIQVAEARLERSDFYSRVYGEVPYVIAGGQANTVEEILSNLPPPANLTSDELAELEETISQMITAITTGAPAPPEMAAEAELPELPELVPPKVPVLPATIQRITIEEILKSLTKIEAPPQIMTDAEWIDLLKMEGYSDADLEEEQRMKDTAVSIVDDWQERNNKLAAFREGIAEMPEYKLTDLLKEMVIQPGLAMVEIAGIYFEHVSMPLAGLAYKGMIPDIEMDYQKLKKSESTWMAASKAWQNMETHGAGEWFTKYMVMEALLDPLTYLGWGIATTLTKPIPYVGRFVGAAERGAVSVFEAPFDLIKTGWRALPKSVGQRALASQHRAGQVVTQYLEKRTGKYFNQITMKDWEDAVDAALKFAKRHPQSEELPARAGRELLKHKTIGPDEVWDWAERLETGLTKEQVTKETVEAVNNVFEDAFMYRMITNKEAGGRLVGILDGHVDDAVKVGQRLIQNRGNQIVKAATIFSMHETPYKAMQALMRRNYGFQTAIEESVTALSRMQAGRFSTLLHGIPVRIQRVWANQVDKFVVRPFAEAYLTFGMYGPMNVFEDYFRSVLGGVFPRRMTIENWEHISWGLSVDPELKRAGISEMIGPLARTGAEEGWSNWILQLGGLAKNWGDKIYTGLVRLPGGFGMDVRRNFIARRYQQILHQKGGPAIEALTKVGPDVPRLVDRKLVKELESEAYRLKMTGNPELIRGAKDLFTRHKIVKNEVNNIYKEHPDLPMDVREHGLRAFDDGRLNTPDGIQVVMREEDDMLVEGFIRGPEHAAKQFEQLADVLTQMEVRNPQEMAVLIQSLNKASEIYGAAPKQILGRAVERTRGLPFLERRAAMDKTLNDLAVLRNRAGASMDKVIVRARAQMSGAGVTPEYTTAAERLFDLQTAKRMRAMEIGGEIDSWRHDFFARADPKDLKTQAFWDDFGAEAQARHHRFNVEMSEYDGRMATATELLDEAGGIKPFARPALKVTDRALAPQDVANLIGARGDDISRTMMDVLASQNDRDMFVAYVLGKVRPGDEGFTREAIGAVYDQIAYSLRVKPEAMTWLTGKRMELEAVRRDLHELHNAKLLPDEEIASIGRYLDETADALDREIFTEPIEEARKAFISRSRELSTHKRLIVGSIESWAEGSPSVDLWYHGGSGDIVSLRQGFFSKDVKLAVDYASTAGNRGKVYVVSGTKGLRFVEPGHMKFVGDVNLVKTFDVWKGFDVSKLGGAKLPARRVKAEYAGYDDLRQSAMDEAHKWYYKEYTDYTNANAFDVLMKSIYPYWTYESQRWFWLPRSFVRHPVVATQLARFMNNSDYGYIHIPGTSADINPMRGTIFGTLTTRLTRRDYPEYYDNLPFAGGYVEFMDFLSRYGFYPGAHMGIPLALMGGREAQLGEVLPASYKTVLDAMIATFPESENFKAISEGIFAERFRNYLTIREVDKRGGNGTLVYSKMKEKKELTEDEQSMWNDARREVALYSAGFEQFGMFRMRSDEQHAMYERASLAIEEMTGFTPDQQDWLRKHGYRLWDMVGGMSPTEQEILQELDYYRWVGSVRPLLPGRQQEILDKIELAWDDVRRFSEGMTARKLTLQREFLSGARGPEDYNDQLIALYTEQRQYLDNKIKEYPLMDMENRKDYYKEFNIPQPVLHPMRELLNLYFSIELKEKRDEETGEIVRDWDNFWAQREAIEDAIPDELRQEWQDYLARNSTRVEELRREVYKTYFRPYNTIWEAALKRYPEEEQKLIQEYLYLERVGQNLARQEQIQNTIRENGRKLISNFRSDVADARQSLRFFNPALDAWLRFWGRTTAFQTPEAEQVYGEIIKEAGRKG